ncbi:PspC domain-containing protein [Streptomyces pseudovenezuelae]|uniref:Phage shock protein PspC (Stress-responsive transcriptional regulator) n=1 Tax=Streptomyces pseudovenezuelae TaxID=67350 RepID=A0ABT6LMC4_9ACTN|nr:PspC domain-containing protein [Streptomyces pseudovenezuelae]MDH6217460.1 phage shock protein PspC (stress-responsive transcriptional regulator) [Streptomyces pseudovenezuelae]
MTDHERAATGPGPGSGPRPTPGAGPQDAAPAPPTAGAGPGAGPEPGQGPGRPAAGGEAGSTDAAVTAEAADTLRKFRRDRDYKMLAGVCAGLGRQCDMDPVIFRITLAVLSATGGIGLIFYGFAWLLVPYQDDEENEVRKLLTGRVDGQALTAVLFALVGCGVFLTMVANGGVMTFAVVLSLLLAGAGYWSRQRGTPDPDPLAAQAAADAPPEAKAPPVPAAYPSWWRDPIVKDGTHVGGTGYLWGPQDSRDRDIAAAVNISLGTPWRSRADIHAPQPPAPRQRGPRWIGGWVFVLAVLAGGLGTAGTWEDHALGTSLQTGLACALIVFGLGIAVSAFLGRTGAGSIFLAIITAALLAGSVALPKDIDTHWIRTTWQPAAVADVRAKYNLGSGVGTLDLSRVHVAKGRTAETEAEVGAGRLKVIVPKDATVKLRIDVGVGDIQLPGDEQKDVDVAPDKHKEVTLTPVTGGKNTGTLDIDIQVGLGQAEVSRAAS